MKKLLYLFVCICLFSCGDTSSKSAHKLRPLKSMKLQYAKGFKLDYHKGFKHLFLYNPSDTSRLEYEYILKEKGAIIPDQFKGITSINIPVKKIVCLTLTQLSYIVELDAVNSLCGVNSSRFLFNEKVKNKIKSGDIKLVGRKGHFKPEILMAQNPDLIFVSPFKAGGYDALKDVGMKLIPVYAYNEKHPLARAEWLKFMAAFIGKEKMADSLFNGIAIKYNSLKKLTATCTNKPIVFSGECKSGVWYAVGGESYLAHYFRDAGADYVWKDNKTAGALRLDFESVYALAAKADYWRILNSFRGDFTYSKLKDFDDKYQDFYAFKNKKVLYCNMRKKAFYETSPVKPHIILADYIKIFHPNLLKDYSARYYELLK